MREAGRQGGREADAHGDGEGVAITSWRHKAGMGLELVRLSKWIVGIRW